MTQFPCTEVGGVSLPRMLIGTSWMLCISHTGPAARPMGKRSSPVMTSILEVRQ